MKLTRWHQAGFVIQTPKGARLAFDLGMGTSTSEVESVNADVLFVSHQHPDHFNVDNAAAVGLVVGPSAVVSQVEKARTFPASSTSSFGFADALIRSVPVNHGPISAMIDHFGYHIQVGQRSIFFMADTKIGPTPSFQFDTLLIPVGGNKVFGPQEASDYIARIGFTGTVVPIHTEIANEEGARSQFLEIVGNGLNVIDLAPGDSSEI